MQADWEVEVGPDAPVIDADWPGSIDLQLHPERALSLEEVRHFPALGHALVRLNQPGSPVRTSKCDFWDPGSVDRDELDAPDEPALSAVACYIDLLAREADFWTEIEDAVRWCKGCCARLHAVPLRSSRVDLVVRAAAGNGQKPLGVTSYLVACGSGGQAEPHLARALGVFAGAVVPQEAATA